MSDTTLPAQPAEPKYSDPSAVESGIRQRFTRLLPKRDPCMVPVHIPPEAVAEGIISDTPIRDIISNLDRDVAESSDVDHVIVDQTDGSCDVYLRVNPKVYQDSVAEADRKKRARSAPSHEAAAEYVCKRLNKAVFRVDKCKLPTRTVLIPEQMVLDAYKGGDYEWTPISLMVRSMISPEERSYMRILDARWVWADSGAYGLQVTLVIGSPITGPEQP